MKAILNKIIEQKHLTRAEAERAIELIVRGETLPEHIGGLLVGLRLKGATLDEVVGFASAMRAHAQRVQVERDDLIDICGTGGDGAGTFNISTTVAFVVAGAGVGVAKHGNRAVSSNCGSTDVLGALGIQAALNPVDAAEALARTGLGFFDAPTFHPAMKRLAEIRRSLGVRTVFNLLGPLTNPAGVRYQLMGIYDRNLLELVANALRELGTTEAMVVAGEDGLDEITLTGKTHVAHLRAGQVRLHTLEPADAGLNVAPKEALLGKGPRENAQIILEVLSGSKGPCRDVVLFNSAAALMVVGRADNLREGVRLAAESIDSRRAMDVLGKHRQSSGASSAKADTARLDPARRSVLDEIAESTRARVAQAKLDESMSELSARARVARRPYDFRALFDRSGTNVIAEVKLASPSEGDIAPGADPVRIAGEYLENGAVALSILTEPHYFKGDLAYLRAIRERYPDARLLMKDFVLDEYQLLQARAYGADAVLILLAMLEPSRARSLYSIAKGFGLTPLVEVHDEKELELAVKMGAELIGINNRDLKTMAVSLDASERLARLAPATAALISESGIKTHEDVKKLQRLGYKGFLVGTHFMRTGTPGAALHKLIRGGGS